MNNRIRSSKFLNLPVCMLLLSITHLMMMSAFPTSAHAGAISQLEGMTGQKIDRYNDHPDKPATDDGEGGRNPLDAPIFMAPAGLIGGVFMGGHWYFKKISGDYPNTLFLEDYLEHQKIKDEAPFSFGAFVGGLPWVGIYAVTAPIRYAVVAMAKAVNTPSAPKAKNNREIGNDFYEQGKLYESSGNLKLAEENYRSAIAYDPKLKGCHSRLAQILFREGKYPEAIESYKQSLAMDSQDAVACKNIADIYRHKLGKKEDAENWYRRALDIIPPDDPTYPAVITDLIDTVNNLKTNESGNSLAKQEKLLGEGKYFEASKTADNYLMLDRKSVKALAIVGEASQKQGDYPKAVNAYNKLVELEPSQQNKNNLSKALDQLKAQAQASLGTAGTTNFRQMRTMAGTCFDEKPCILSEDTPGTSPSIAPRPTVQQLLDKVPQGLKNDPKVIEIVEDRKHIDEEIKTNSKEIDDLWNLRNNYTSPDKIGAINLLIVNKQEEKNKLEYEASIKDKQFDNYLNMSFTPPDNPSPVKAN